MENIWIRGFETKVMWIYLLSQAFKVIGKLILECVFKWLKTSFLRECKGRAHKNSSIKGERFFFFKKKGGIFCVVLSTGSKIQLALDCVPSHIQLTMLSLRWGLFSLSLISYIAFSTFSILQVQRLPSTYMLKMTFENILLSASAFSLPLISLHDSSGGPSDNKPAPSQVKHQIYFDSGLRNASLYNL